MGHIRRDWVIANGCLSNKYDWTDRERLGPPTMALNDILGGTSLFPGLSITFLFFWGLFLYIGYRAM